MVQKRSGNPMRPQEGPQDCAERCQEGSAEPMAPPKCRKAVRRRLQEGPKAALRPQNSSNMGSGVTKQSLGPNFRPNLRNLRKAKKRYVFHCFFVCRRPRMAQDSSKKASRKPQGSPETARRWCPKSLNEFWKQCAAQTCQTFEKQQNVAFPLFFRLQKPPNAARQVEGSPKSVPREP